jgi:hypothetical protein
MWMLEQKQDRYQELRGELHPEPLLQAAHQIARLTDFGDDSFGEPLRKLLDCAARETDFHPPGLQYFKSEVIRCLVNRLRVQHDIVAHPEILDEDVSDPIIILGLGRSGTTKLHKMLSTPDDMEKTVFWRVWNPGRFPDAVPGQPDPRIAAAGTTNLVAGDNPVLDAAHQVQAQEVEENWAMLLPTFDNWVWNATTPMPSYFDWVIDRPSVETFGYEKTCLQYLQWQDGGKQGRSWVLKSTGSIADMDALVACYPNATFVHPHRDPRDTTPSWAKFMCGMWGLQANLPDPSVIGAESQKHWSAAMARYLEARERLGLDDRIVDVKYEQVRTDPMAIMHEVYRRCGREVSRDAERKMAAWHAGNEQGQHGRHEYSLQEFGLSESGVDAAFAGYIERFIER